MYYAEGTHPAIIDKEMYEMAKKEMQRRRDDRNNAIGSSRYTSKYPLSGLLICGICGHRLRRHVRTVGSGAKVPAWGYANRIENGRNVCNSHHINEDQLQRTYLAAIREMIDSAEEIVSAVCESAGLIMEPDNRNALNKVEQQIIDLQAAALELHKAKKRMAISEADCAAQVRSYKEQMDALEEKQAALQTTGMRYTEVRAWLAVFEEHIKTGAIMNVDDGIIIKQMVKQIIIGDTSMEIHFQCGVVIEQDYTE